MAEDQMIKDGFYVQISKELSYNKDEHGFDLLVYPNQLGEVIESEQHFKFFSNPNHTYKVLLKNTEQVIEVKHKYLLELTMKEMQHLDEVVLVLESFRPIPFNRNHSHGDIIKAGSKIKITNFLDYPTGRYPVFMMGGKFHSIPYNRFIPIADLRELHRDISEATKFEL